ncbi:hypothetical protein GGU10DRAFT_437615 [Lentinula aff. detonsa]|uniref:Uncharacterized protein n=1 Tax=Lentinula aff. detonsa TaxID=2804958 RepID=A0AA38NNK1_9AGAR|nr:hypothetical protein GGU10DRAFT_437615 [Lentinula aff. detonsa]
MPGPGAKKENGAQIKREAESGDEYLMMRSLPKSLVSNLNSKGGLKRVHSNVDAIWRRLDEAYTRYAKNERILIGIMGWTLLEKLRNSPSLACWHGVSRRGILVLAEERRSAYHDTYWGNSILLTTRAKGQGMRVPLKFTKFKLQYANKDQAFANYILVGTI